MKGYKTFHWDLSARPLFKGAGCPDRFGYFKYKIGGMYSMDARPVLCAKGFHFCQSVTHAYKWYPNRFDTRICEVDVTNAVVQMDVFKCAANRITIVRELTPREILDKLTEDDIWLGYAMSYSKVIADRLTESIRHFQQAPGSYVLWHGVSGRARCPRPRDLPELEKRADEWLAVLDTLKQERNP